MRKKTDYERAAEDPLMAVEMAREAMILEATEAIARAMAERGVNSAQLAERLGYPVKYVDWVLSGPRDLDLATVGEFLHALGYEGAILVTDKLSFSDIPFQEIEVEKTKKEVK